MDESDWSIDANRSALRGDLAGRDAHQCRYTFGYHRFEDLAGVGIVAIIALTAAAAAYESYRAMLRPKPVGHLALSMAAARRSGCWYERTVAIASYASATAVIRLARLGIRGLRVCG